MRTFRAACVPTSSALDLSPFRAGRTASDPGDRRPAIDSITWLRRESRRRKAVRDNLATVYDAVDEGGAVWCVDAHPDRGAIRLSLRQRRMAW
jgi:hypothetical protein